ncbi:hypothetical protein HJC23_002172 [Cyclotella cryptica]|uniref:Uncharacterized protein n=1 Tax=Cyclotella cryptica TaxID=29204 RepID=A0ABD3Q8E0_9STRA|eukprot:CCRYP_008204-RA/>CCRYP_008204-RA protein AED:0.27 eAED:0.27 QI:0/-1/0/1/-1/1/1/0/166
MFRLTRTLSSAIDKLAENKIAEWLRSGGDEALSSSSLGRRLPNDRHGSAAKTLGVHHDYVHSKILADNNIRPESVERRLQLDKAWEDLKQLIRRDYADSNCKLKEYVASADTARKFGEAIEALDEMARKCNNAIISDSVRFNGRSPVRHCRRFSFAERITEAIIDS